jgi:hypothetical protein
MGKCPAIAIAVARAHKNDKEFRPVLTVEVVTGADGGAEHRRIPGIRRR